MMNISRSFIKKGAIMGGVYALLALVVVYPIGRLVITSFRIDVLGGVGRWSLANFEAMIAGRAFIMALKNTMIIGCGGVIMATTLGVVLAWFVARTDMPFKRIIEPLNLVPFYLSSLVGSLSWEILAAPKTGMLNLAAKALFGLSSPVVNIYSMVGIIFLLALFSTPYVYLFTIGSLQNMDPALEEASRISGATTIQTMLRVTFPLAAPAILSATVLTFILMAEAFAVPLVLGRPERINTLATLIYSQTNLYPPRYNAAAAMSCFLLSLTIFLVIVQRKILARRHFWTVTGKGYRPSLIRLKGARWVALGINLAYLVVTLLPFAIMVFMSFLHGWEGEFKFNFSLKNYVRVLFENDVTRRGFTNSIIIAVVGATSGVILFSILASLIHRTKMPGRSGIDFIGMLPVTFPGIVLGMGFLLAWIKTPLYGTLWILILAYVVHFMPTGLRSLSATLGSISPDLDESARVSGASWFGALGRILMPLMWPGIISAWLLLFVIFMREVSSSMMLFVHGTETISIALIQIMDYEPQGASAAFGSIQTVMILAAVYIFRKLMGHQRMSEKAGE